MADVSAKGQVTTAVRPIPEGYHTATPYLAIKGAAQAIEFYKKAFGATEMLRLPQPDGRVGHAEIKIGDSYIRPTNSRRWATAVPNRSVAQR